MLRPGLTVLALALGVAVGAQAPAPASAVIDAPQLLRDLEILSADDMEGRQAGTPGGEKARAYVVARFKASGLQPFGASFEQPFTFTGGRSGAQAERRGVNVVGRIAGTTTPGRFIVITAHYDHIGVRNGQVFNGADDNASGTAALFALAKHFTANRPAHSLIFAALDAEESGLRGARAFVAAPPVDASSIVLNVNMDMIGRDPKDLLYVVGTYRQPFLKPYIERIAARAPVTLVMGHDDPTQKTVENWTNSSDHRAFCEAKIPCLYFGVEDFENHHRATDDYATMTHGFYVRAVETMVLAVKEFDASLEAIANAAGRGGVTAAGTATAVEDARPGQQTGDPVEIAVPGGKVAGTLLMPAAATGKVPAALIIAGSGPTDRDGNSALAGRNDSLRRLAEALADAGVASLRYDKRGLGGSAVSGLSEADLRFETFVQDAASWVSFLRNDPRVSTITVLGHSEGALIGMLAARAARADGFVSIAGPGQRASDLLRAQLTPQLAALPELAAASEAVLASLEAGETTTALPALPALAQLFRPSVQPYLISWFTYRPTEAIARLAVPVLIVQGTTDIQVPVTEAEALGRAKPDARLTIVPGMNHVLKLASDPTQQRASYGDPSLPIAPALAEAMTGFVRAVDRAPQPRRPPGQRLSLRDTVVASIGGALLGIEYGRPSKRGREIWGALVPWGRSWMPGADESTTFTTNRTLQLGTLVVPPGDYSIYTRPEADGTTLILNRDTGQFHTVYRAGRDLGRVPMTRRPLERPVERLTFALEATAAGGVLELLWDDRGYSAPFTVTTSAGR
jgi:pimeloyl-ACP methyl ester carboxylesterase